MDIFIVFYSIHEMEQQQRLGTAYTNSVRGVRTLRVVAEGYNRSDTKIMMIRNLFIRRRLGIGLLCRGQMALANLP